MKRITLLITILLLLTSLSFGDENTSVYFNNKHIQFENIPFITEGAILLPFEDYLTLIGTQYSWDENEQTLTVYRDNMFLKLITDSEIAYKNGKSFPLENPMQTINGNIYIPLDFVSDAYNIIYEFDSSENTLKLSSQSINSYKTYTNYFYKTIEIHPFNISFDIPYYWNILDEEENIYGLRNEFENNTLTCYAFKETGDMTVDEYMLSLDVYTRSLFDEGRINLIDEKFYYSAGFKGIYKSYAYDFIDESTIHSYYVLKADDVFYVFKFLYNQEDASYLSDIVNNIIDSFEIKSFAIDSDEEHYVEYPKMTSSKMILENPFYSNMQVQNFLFINGSIDPNIQYLVAEVSKDDENLSFKIPVVDGLFNGRIYLPFGLGRHNVILKIDSELDIDTSSELVDLVIDSDVLMKFSLINTSAEFIRYTIPDDGIISNHIYISSMSNLLTYDSISDYTKSFKLFNYMVDNISIRNEITSSDPYEVYINLEGNALGVTQYFASLLRNIGIPARVYHGIQDFTSYYWTEVYLNGNWFVIDPAQAIIFNDQENSNNYFVIQLEEYHSYFDFINEITH